MRDLHKSGHTVRFLEVKRHSANPMTADKTVKVPEMAESISEGTLKQWSKSPYFLWHNVHVLGTRTILSDATEIGDYVEQDEEIATIETDKVGQLGSRSLSKY